MTDLEINIELAKAMGWVKLSEEEWLFNQEVVGFLLRYDLVVCVTCSKEFDEDGEKLFLEKIFDYRDPVIFVAICKHWALDVSFSGVVFPEYEAKSFRSESIEKSAALCVIDLAKRGFK